MARGPGRTGRPFRRARQQLLASTNVCLYCHGHVDVMLDGRARWGPTYAHIVALVEGGSPLDPANRALAHNRCNIIAENKRRAQARKAHTKGSRDW